MKKNLKLLPFIFTVFLLILFYFKRYFVIRYYPPVMNFCIFSLFFSSLFWEETIIQKFAKAIDGELTPEVKIYTKNLTYIWIMFLFLNFLLSVITIFLPDKIWLFYNGFLSYFLVGLLFIVEYIIRIILKKKHKL